jgi:hypothetical protein
MRWANFTKAGSDENTGRELRRADMRLPLLHRWRADYLADIPELRKPDGRVIRLDQGREITT